ncbi:hypothetical protein ALMP_49800 [Streptomyces sp. A012304]|nr:HAD family hydrolase [Streptomyces sp. A012304]GKQ38449.1 hypothetical protein ALMP_49800 [Streptomyces sp. A012304]
MKYVLFDVDGTLMDAVSNQRQVWATWAERYGLDADEVYQVALRTRPMETFAQVAEDGKPSPVPYLLAAEQLGVEPGACLVIEDAPSGVRSGLRAGMTVWGVNAAVAVEGVHRHFVSLREAVPHILAFASGPHGNAAA